LWAEKPWQYNAVTARGPCSLPTEFAMHPRILIAGLLLATGLSACGSKGPLVLPPPPDGQARPASNPNMPQPSYPQIQTQPQ